MTSSTVEQAAQGSRFLQLPREIRDLIYEHALVRDTVPIDCAVVAGPGYRKHTGFPCPHSPQLHEAYPLNRDVVHRSTWSLPVYDLNIDIQGGTWMEPKRAQMTYQIAPACANPKDGGRHDGVAVQLLQACRTVHSEARPIFYNKNVFSFTGRFPVSTALAFVQDRPVTARPLLSSIELVLIEDNNMRGTADAHFPPTRRSSDCLVLQHAFHYFTDLCTLLSSPTFRLRRLYLTIESVTSFGDSQPESLSECLIWEAEKSGTERPLVASWIQPLLRITNLESVKIYWISDRPRVRRMSDTLSTMQRSMLRRADSVTDDREHILHGHVLEFGILSECCDNTTTSIIFDPKAEHFESGDCSCEDRPAGLEHVPTGSKQAFYKCGVATWKEHQTYFTGYKSAYTAYCELHSTCSSRTARRRSSACALHLDR